MQENNTLTWSIGVKDRIVLNGQRVCK